MMDTTPEKYIERLNELVGKKRVLLLDILAITQEQANVISEDGLDKLNKLIANKQLKIDAIIKLDEEFSIYFQRLKSTMGIKSLDQLDVSKLDGTAPEGARQLKKQTEGLMDIIRNISEMETVNNQKSKNLLDEFGKEIKMINLNKKANTAYRPEPINVPSYFVDKKK